MLFGTEVLWPSNPLPDQISYLRWFPKLELSVKRILELVRESLRARRRQAAYEEVVDELGEFTDDSDYDDE